MIRHQGPDPQVVTRLLKSILESAGGSAGREASKAELEVHIATVVVHTLQQLSADIRNAQTILGTRAEQLTEELGELRSGIGDAAATSSRQADALVFWTKGLVIATAAFVLIALLDLLHRMGMLHWASPAPPAL